LRFLKQDTENIVFRRIFVREIRWITFKVVMDVRIIYNNNYVYLMSPPIFDFRHQTHETEMERRQRSRRINYTSVYLYTVEG